MLTVSQSDLGSQCGQSGYDPLQYDVDLPLRARYYPLGHPFDLETNSEDVIAAAEVSFGAFPGIANVDPVRFRIAVKVGASDEVPEATLPRGMGNLIAYVHGRDNYALADFARGFAFGWFTTALVADQARFRYHFLESITYLMLGSLYLAPVHAACIALDGRGVLLCGDSGAGKTSLAYAMARRGWTYVADDGPHLVRSRPERIILGRPHYIRFRNSCKDLFPELARFPAVVRPNGKPDVEVSTAALGIHTAWQTPVEAVVFLNRQPESQPRLDTFPKAEALRRFRQVLCFGEPHVRQQQSQCIERLLDRPVASLTYNTFDDAERFLRQLLP